MKGPSAALSRALAVALAALGCARAERGPASILLVTLDTTRADRIGAYGYAAAQTPTLDRLAREGVLFEAALAPAPITLPSHASILTGVTPPAHGVRDNGFFALGPRAELLPEALRQSGHRTGAFVGSFVLHPRYGLDQGFEVYRAPEPGAGASPGFEPERRADAVVDDALAWLAQLAPGEPFFVWLHLFDPHYPYAPPEPWRSRQTHPYDGEIAFVDHELGRLLRALEQDGRARNLLVAVTADHGESAGEHGEGSHGVFLYQATLHVPLLLWGAPVAAAAGSRVAESVSLVELPATLLALAGLSPGLLPHAAGPPLLAAGGVARAPDPERAHYVESLLPYFSFRWRGLRGLVQGGYKLVEGVEPELYALGEDPREQRDLAAALPERVERLRARLRAEAARSAALGWGGGRTADAQERELLRSLGYLAGSAGDDPFAAELPDPRERIGDVELASKAAARLARASEKQPLEPGAFAPVPSGERVPGRRNVLRARRLLLELRERNPADPHVFRELGIVESLLGNRAAALPLLERAAQLDPSDLAVRYHLEAARSGAAP
jgi:arylsulfatase A-like enzyme